MKNLFKAIMAVAAAGAAVVAGKLCYDFFVKKNGEMNDDFFDDLEDDFSEVIFEDEFFSFDTEPEKETETKSESVKVVKVNPAKPATDTKADEKKEEPKQRVQAQVISDETRKVLEAAVSQITGGKGRITDIKKV